MLNKFIYNLLAVAVTVFLIVLTFGTVGLAVKAGWTGGVLDLAVFIPFALLAFTLWFLFGDWDES